MTQTDLQAQFGPIDIYLFDQLLKGRLTPGNAVLDAGCGCGRNLVYLLRNGFHVWGVDHDAGAIAEAEAMAHDLARDAPRDRFRVAPVEAMPFPDGMFDFVICNAVLHFSRGEAHFRAMTAELARVLKPGGVFFARLMSTHGVEHLVTPLGDRRHRLPAGPDVFLVDERLLMEITELTFRGALLDPLKSTIVHGQRTMTTWVVRRG